MGTKADLLHRYYTAMLNNQQDWPAFEAFLREHLAQDVQFEDFPFGNTAQDAGLVHVKRRSGVSEVIKLYEELPKVVLFEQFDLVRVVEGEEKAFAWLYIAGTATATGTKLADEILLEWTFDSSGKIKGLRHWMDTKKHIEAFQPSVLKSTSEP
ncbi:hypothetical protein N2152v2_003423 [Parachlorella kessleri]